MTKTKMIRLVVGAFVGAVLGIFLIVVLSWPVLLVLPILLGVGWLIGSM